MKRYFLLPLLLLLLTGAIAQAQPVTIRVATYNVLNYGTPDSARAAAVATIVEKIHADVLVVHEIAGWGGWSNFLRSLPSRMNYLPGLFTDGPDTDNAMFVDTTAVTYFDHLTIAGGIARTLEHWGIVVRGTTDTLHIIGCHLQAGTTTEDKDIRNQEAMAIRTWIDNYHRIYPARHFVLAGDLNVYTSAEAAYQTLLAIGGPTTSGALRDPIERPGAWHADSSFAGIMTQSPRVGQSGGGLVDRFDFLLISPPLMAHYLPGTYTTYGNDGKHFNDSINAMPNTAVDSGTAQALYDASDHLPVYLDLMFQMIPSGVEEEKLVPVEMDLSEVKREFTKP